MSSLRELLSNYRAHAQTEREKGNYFERLAVAFIKNDPGVNGGQNPRKSGAKTIPA